MNIFEKELTENYMAASRRNRVVIHDIALLAGMVKRGIMPRSVILGTGSEAKSLEPVIRALGLDVPVHRAPEEQVAAFLSEKKGKKIKPYALSALVEVPVEPFAEETLADFRRVVMLKNVRFVLNIARIINLCDWFGADALLLSESSACPFVPTITDITEYRNLGLPVIFFPDGPEEYMPVLHGCGFKVIGTALGSEAIGPEALREFSDKRTALLFGNETFGLYEEDIEMCDHVVRIPIAEGIDSLNVAEACGIALYELTSRDLAEKEL